MDFSKVTSGEWVIVFATLMGPIFAVQAQKFLEGLREHRNAKLWVFRTLMTTRKSRLHADHVKALNMIDVVFYGVPVFMTHWQSQAEAKVATAWKVYLDNLATETDGWPESRKEVLWAQRESNFGSLLGAIAASVGYNFDEVHLKKAGYIPVLHSNNEEKLQKLLDDGLALVQGTQALKMNVVSLPPNENIAEAYVQMMKQLIAVTKSGSVKVSAMDSVPNGETVDAPQMQKGFQTEVARPSEQSSAQG